MISCKRTSAGFVLGLLFLVLHSLSVTAQPTQQVQQVEAEGRRLYRSEAASWHGTDVLREYFPAKAARMGGYISYDHAPDSTVRCVLMSNDVPSRVMLVCSFNEQVDLRSLRVDTTERPPTPHEVALLKLRNAAKEAVLADKTIGFPERTAPNFVPLQDATGSRVYILTGPQDNGVILFGNDYLLTFDDAGRYRQTTSLHRSLLTLKYGSNGLTKETGSMHTHVVSGPGELITPD